MRTPNLQKALESLSGLVAKKQMFVRKEREAIDKVNRGLKRMGFQILPVIGNATGKRPGRPLGSRNKESKSDVDGGRPLSIKRRRPGRPSLKKAA